MKIRHILQKMHETAFSGTDHGHLPSRLDVVSSISTTEPVSILLCQCLFVHLVGTFFGFFFNVSRFHKFLQRRTDVKNT